MSYSKHTWTSKEQISTDRMNAIESGIDEAASTADSAVSVASSAQSTADSAVSAATSAQSTADSAVSAANSAQSTADSAVSAANSAQSTADSAVSAASNAQSTADAATERTDISDYVTMEDDVDGSVVCAYALGGWVFLQLLISNTETSTIDIATVRSPYRPVKQSFGFYANLSASYPNALLFTRVQTGGGITARFTMATTNSYLTYIYPIA